MARQRGPVKIQGTIGDINFYRTADGFLARIFNPVSAQKIATDPRFARVRENMAEFRRAGKAGRLLRQATKFLLTQVKDNRVSTRLTAAMMRVIKADTTSPRGQRNVVDGQPALLRGFNFNRNSNMESIMYADYTTSINRNAGTLTVNIPSFPAVQFLKAPAGATHFKLVSLGTEVDFAAETFGVEHQESDMIPVDAATTPAINMVNQVTPDSQLPLFLLLGLQFYQLVAGTYYPLKAGTLNALSIVEVDA